LVIASLKSGGRSVGIVRSGTQTMEFVCCLLIHQELRRKEENEEEITKLQHKI
jgi:hypothetical protein